MLFKVIDWKDGIGEKPAAPLYIGPRGFVVDAVDATDIGLQRGSV
ncbi:MAG: hypothetical protein JWQ83_1144 [Lacunisphaera sp.]|nr:hypothetical protein [Lacunisphaera sp.]